MNTLTKLMLAAALATIAILGGTVMGEDAKAGQVGAKAPEFRLNDHTGRGVRLSDVTKDGSWVVLAFYPKAMTPGCTKEVCSLRDASKEFAEAGVKVFGVSLDDVQSQAEFVKQQELNFPLLSDPDGSLSSKLDVLYADKPYTKRITVVIDPSGIIRARDEKVTVDAHGKDLLELLANLKTK